MYSHIHQVANQFIFCKGVLNFSLQLMYLQSQLTTASYLFTLVSVTTIPVINTSVAINDNITISVIITKTTISQPQTIRDSLLSPFLKHHCPIHPYDHHCWLSSSFNISTTAIFISNGQEQ